MVLSSLVHLACVNCTPHLGATDSHIQFHTDAHTGHLGGRGDKWVCQSVSKPAGIPLSKQLPGNE